MERVADGVLHASAPVDGEWLLHTAGTLQVVDVRRGEVSASWAFDGAASASLPLLKRGDEIITFSGPRELRSFRIEGEQLEARPELALKADCVAAAASRRCAYLVLAGGQLLAVVDGAIARKARLTGAVRAGAFVQVGEDLVLLVEQAPHEFAYGIVSDDGDALGISALQRLDAPAEDLRNAVASCGDLLTCWSSGAVRRFRLRDGELEPASRVEAPAKGCHAAAAMERGFVLSIDADMQVNLREARCGISVLRTAAAGSGEARIFSAEGSAAVVVGGRAALLTLPAAGARGLVGRDRAVPLADEKEVNDIVAWWRKQGASPAFEQKAELERRLVAAARAGGQATEALATLRIWPLAKKLLRRAILPDAEAVRLLNARPQLTWAFTHSVKEGTSLVAALRAELNLERMPAFIAEISKAMRLHRNHPVKELELIPELPPLSKLFTLASAFVDAKFSEIALLGDDARKPIEDFCAASRDMMKPAVFTPKLLASVNGLAMPLARQQPGVIQRWLLWV